MLADTEHPPDSTGDWRGTAYAEFHHDGGDALSGQFPRRGQDRHGGSQIGRAAITRKSPGLIPTARYENPRYVVVVMVEDGAFGGHDLRAGGGKDLRGHFKTGTSRPAASRRRWPTTEMYDPHLNEKKERFRLAAARRDAGLDDHRHGFHFQRDGRHEPSWRGITKITCARSSGTCLGWARRWRVCTVEYGRLARWAAVFYWGSIVVLLAVFAIGAVHHGGKAMDQPRRLSACNPRNLPKSRLSCGWPIT